MSRFERENLSKRVKVVSQVFAVFAGLGILIIGLQLFSKSTGFDIFNIQYSLSKLFSDEARAETRSVISPEETTRPYLVPDILAPDNTEALIKAASFLQNDITVTPITPSQTTSGDSENGNKTDDEFTVINIAPMRTTGDLFTPSSLAIYYKNINQNGILPKVKEAKFSKWSVGISLAPAVSYRKLKYTNLDEIMTRRVGNTQYGFYQSQKERNKLDKALMKYSLGLDIIFRVNKKLSFQSGLVYLNTGESLLIKETGNDPNNPNSLAGTGAENHYFFEGPADFESPDATESEDNIRFANNISYLEVPLLVNYRIKAINDLTDIEIQLGASVTRLDYVSAMVYNFDNDGYYLISGSNPAVFQKYGSNAIMGITYNKYITNRIQLFANPHLKMGLTNMFDANYNIKQHYYLTGVRLGMKINL